MTIWNSKEPTTLSTYALIFIYHIHHMLWIEWLTFKFSTTTILNSKQAPFLRPSSKIHNTPPINATFFLAQLPWCQKQVNPCCLHLHCHHYQNNDTTILKCWCFQHLRIVVLLFSWSVLLFLLCVLHIQFCDLKPVQAFIFWIPVEMY